MIMYKEGA